MEDFRVMEVIEGELKLTLQPLSIFKLSKVDYINIDAPMFKMKDYSFSTTNTEIFLCARDSDIGIEIESAAYSESIVSLDMSEFRIFYDVVNRQSVKKYIHKSIIFPFRTGEDYILEERFEAALENYDNKMLSTLYVLVVNDKIEKYPIPIKYIIESNFDPKPFEERFTDSIKNTIIDIFIFIVNTEGEESLLKKFKF